MAMVGTFLFIIIVVFIIWVAFMDRFERIGNRVTKKIEKTFKEKKEND